MKRIFFLLLLCSVFILTGCWDITEPERMYYIHGVGVDYVDGHYEIYTQIIDFANVAKTEQPNPDVKQMEVGRAKGKTINEAFLNLYHSLDMRLFWGHLSYVLFTEEALAEGRGNSVLNSFSRYRETRYQIWVHATDEKLEDLLLATPVLNKSITLSKLANPLNSYEQQSEIAPRNFRQTILQLQEPNYLVAIPFVTVGEQWQNDQEKLKVVQMQHIAFVTKDGLKIVAKKEDVNGLQWLNSETKRAEISFFVRGEAVTAIIEHLSVKVEPVQQKFHITVKVNAIISAFNTELTEKEAKEQIRTSIEDQIKKTYQYGLEQQLDVFRLSHVLYKKNVRLFKEIEKDGQIPLSSDTLASVEIVVEQLSGARKEFTEVIP